MKFSLLIGTLNRPQALKCCIRSLRLQSYTDYEIIIIDQSDNLETEYLIQSLMGTDIIYKRVNYKGLSRARNEALKKATGDYFCLIDDDAWYEVDFLKNASELLNSSRKILSGYIYDTTTKKDFAAYRNKYHNRKLSLRMIMRTCPSAALVIPMQVIKDVGYFDEWLGVGSPFGAAEETDLLLRAIQNGYDVYYAGNLRLKHPIPVRTGNNITAQKFASYYSGFGALYRKHLLDAHMISLTFCFAELYMKLFVKRMLPLKYKKEYIIAAISEFYRGLYTYVKISNGELGSNAKK